MKLRYSNVFENANLILNEVGINIRFYLRKRSVLLMDLILRENSFSSSTNL